MMVEASSGAADRSDASEQGGKISERLQLLLSGKNKLLSVYLTAGFPGRDDTVPLCEMLEHAGADLVEIGMPFSDPVADGPTIQASSTAALANGMTLELLFKQLTQLRERVTIPVFLMGYLNPLLQFGIDRFAACAAEAGIDGIIIPDLPLEYFEHEFRDSFERSKLSCVFLITPRSTVERIRRIDGLSTSFIYAVSSAAVTGAKLQTDALRREYLERLAGMQLAHPVLVGFGIHDRASFAEATASVRGAIIGSAFIRALEGSDSAGLSKRVRDFVGSIR